MKYNYPFDDLRTLSTEGYFARYEDECKRQPTFREAWQTTEEVYRCISGKPRYTSYNTFRVALSRRRKNLLHQI